MEKQKGKLSINSENIFPIIKKWLYSDHDIFIRELVSNGCDAITKMKKLDIMGEVDIPTDYKYKMTVIVDPEAKTIQFNDNGIGMTEEEVKEYITQIAFSGATDFLEKYKDKTSDDQIIGHFGLGFYSAFMVAEKVTLETLSFQKDATSVYWESDGSSEYSMNDGTKTEYGTSITLYLNDESYEFSNEYRVREILEKYCSFMPVEIFMFKANAEQEFETIDATEVREDDIVVENIVEEVKPQEEGEEATEPVSVEKAKIHKRPVSLSDTTPLWTKHPNDCTEEEYKSFFRTVFHDYKEPLFWIHLNMDYPFNLKGILYFPKLSTEYDNLEGVIKLYNNQVFIADNIKEVIPEFLMLLKGVIDCPDLPLNVSRSALQNDGFVKKISDYITKKVADKLAGLYKVEKDIYEKYWDDISPFIKYGCLKDEKFNEKMKDFIIFKNLDEKYITLPEYVEATKKDAEDKTIVYYVTDLKQQAQYIHMFKEEKKEALILTHNIDQPFITQIEAADETLKFQRIDSEISKDSKEELEEDALKEETEVLTELFRKALDMDKLEIKVEKLKNEKVSSVITLSEESRRMQEMMKMYNLGGMDEGAFNMGETLILNANNTLVQYILDHKEEENITMFCEQLYDLAMISHKPLSAEAMMKFVARSNEVMMLLTK